MIQILTGNKKNGQFAGEGAVVSLLHEPRSLDEFEVNIFDLQDANIWKDDNLYGESINAINDFKSLSVMIRNSKRTKIII